MWYGIIFLKKNFSPIFSLNIDSNLQKSRPLSLINGILNQNLEILILNQKIWNQKTAWPAFQDHTFLSFLHFLHFTFLHHYIFG